MVIIFITLSVILFLVVVYYYNKLKSHALKVEESFANMDVMLKQRFDTLPNAIETVKGYVKHEHGTLTKVTELRDFLKKASLSEREKLDIHQKLTRYIPDLFAIAEDYPDLKASENFIHLQHTINDLEENIAATRRTYNAEVNLYNTSIKTFPGNVFAKIFGFQTKEVFEIPDEQRETINVKF